MNGNYKSFIIIVNRQSALALAQNAVNHRRSKHTDVWYHFVCDVVEKGLVDLYYVSSTENDCDACVHKISLKSQVCETQTKGGLCETSCVFCESVLFNFVINACRISVAMVFFCVFT